MANLGIVPLIPIAIKAIPVILSFLGGKKAKDKAEQAEYDASAAAVAAGTAVKATDLMTDRDIQMLRLVWSQVRNEPLWERIDWAKYKMPQGPQLSRNGEFAIRYVWPQVHGAAHFNDVNWQYHAIPLESAAAVMPIPELPPNMRPLTPQDAMLLDPRTLTPAQASLFSGDIPTPLMVGGIGLALLILLSQRR